MIYCGLHTGAESKIITKSHLFLLIALSISIFTCFYNPLQYPPLLYDEGTYIGRAVNLITTHSPQKGTLYDHPFFGQVFLGGALWLAGYSNFSPIVHQDNLVAYVESLWFVPRLLIGMMGLVDAYLVYKISERKYNTWVAFIASVLFALMPIVWFLRTVYLESLQLPFLLSSILIALYAKDTTSGTSGSRKAHLLILSGALMGLAIFTKISVFSIMPVFAFIFWTNRNEIQKSIGIWLIPVVLIPLIWPAYALFNGDIDRWWDGVYWQSHRQMEGINFMEITKEKTLLNAISLNFYKAPLIIGIGFVGLAYSVFRRDLFLLLWTAPFLLFLLFVGFVREFHLIPLLPVLSISAARFIEGMLKFITKKKVYDMSLACIISAIVIFGVINSVILFSSSQNNGEIIGATATILWYLQDNPNENLTMVSSHVYSWIPKYILRTQGQYLPPEVSAGQDPQHDKVILVADRSFVSTMSDQDAVGRHLRQIYEENSRKNVSIMYYGKYKVILPGPWPSDNEQTKGINLLDSKHKWTPNSNTRISQSNTELKITPFSKTQGEYSHAVLTARLKDMGGAPVLLSINYVTNSSNKDTRYFLDLVDARDPNLKFWKYNLPNTSGNVANSLFIIPEDAFDRNIQFRLGIIPKSIGENFIVKRAALVSPSLT